MLGGVQPFCADSMKDLEKIILEGKYDKLEDISDEANDLINRMLQLDPKKRLTDDEILNHPWIANINLNHRSKLSLFTDAEKILLSKFNVDYLSSDKSELIENFTLKNLETNKDSKDEPNKINFMWWFSRSRKDYLDLGCCPTIDGSGQASGTCH